MGLVRGAFSIRREPRDRSRDPRVNNNAERFPLSAVFRKPHTRNGLASIARIAAPRHPETAAEFESEQSHRLSLVD